MKTIILLFICGLISTANCQDSTKQAVKPSPTGLLVFKDSNYVYNPNNVFGNIHIVLTPWKEEDFNLIIKK